MSEPVDIRVLVPKRDERLLAIGDRLAAAVAARWTGEGDCDCECCAAAREWIAARRV